MWPDEDLVFLRAKRYQGHRARLPLYREQKYDGYRVLFTREDQDFHLWTRGVHQDLPLRPFWALPRWTAVDCELVWPGHPAAQVPTALKSCPEVLQCLPFAVPFFHGHSYLNSSYEQMHQLVLECTRVDVPYKVLDDVDEVFLLAEARANSYEGWILKEEGYNRWWKIKVSDTLDLRVVGFKPGKGKYEGVVGALVLADSSGKEVSACSGMDDQVRLSLSESDVGRICEVEFNEITVGGRLKHPRFIRWRDDKEEADAVKGDQTTE